MDDENRNFAKRYLVIPHQFAPWGRFPAYRRRPPHAHDGVWTPFGRESRAGCEEAKRALSPVSENPCEFAKRQTIRYTSDSPLEGATRVYTPLRSHLKTTPNPIYSPIFLPSPPPDMVFPVYITMGNTTSMRASIRIACTWPRRDLLARSPRMPRRHSDAASDAPPPSNLYQNHAPTGHYPAPALPTPLPPARGTQAAHLSPSPRPGSSPAPAEGESGRVRAG